MLKINCVDTVDFLLAIDRLSYSQVELHVHLDGAIRVGTILDVAK